MNKERFKIFIAAYLVLEKDGKILLQKRANTGYQDGNYGLVSGHFDGDETAEECIARETKEEANITLKTKDLTVVHTMHHFAPDKEYIEIYIKANSWEGEIKNIEPNKCDDLSWFPIDDLPENIIPSVKFALNNIKNKKYYSSLNEKII